MTVSSLSFSTTSRGKLRRFNSAGKDISNSERFILLDLRGWIGISLLMRVSSGISVSRPGWAHDSLRQFSGAYSRVVSKGMGS